MKRLLCMAMLVTCISAYGSIFEITHPASVCPSDNPLFKVRYFYFFNPSSPPQQHVLGVKWEFIQNGKVIKTLNSQIFDRITLGQIGQAEVFAGSLPAGTTTVKVTITTLTVTSGGSGLSGESFQKVFTVGIKKPTSISGPSPICPGQTHTFSTPALDNVTSYTWQVPSGWSVNGIPGPVVTGQGNVVNITSPSYESGTTPGITVSGQSTMCGSGLAYTRYFAVDYEYSIYTENLGGSNLRLTVQGPYSSQYTWQLPEWWTLIYDYGSYIEVSANGPGTANVTVQTPCGNYQTISYVYTASGCDPNIQVYPTYFEDFLIVDPGPGPEIIGMQMRDYQGNEMFFDYWSEGSGYRIDTSWFPRTMYILRVTDWTGCTTDFQVAKLPY